jgi:hypothetical protein
MPLPKIRIGADLATGMIRSIAEYWTNIKCGTVVILTEISVCKSALFTL